MPDKEFLKAVGYVLGILLSLPLILVLVKFARFLSHIESTTKSTEGKVDLFITETRAMLLDHDRSITNIKAELRWRRSTDTQEEVHG